MKTITVYCPEGAATYTDHVSGHEVESHITAGGRFAEEARALKEFALAGEVPNMLLGGQYVLQAEGREENIDFARYIEVQ